MVKTKYTVFVQYFLKYCVSLFNYQFLILHPMMRYQISYSIDRNPSGTISEYTVLK